MTGREYWRVRGAWHALRLTRALLPRAACGRFAVAEVEFADRVPANGHLCGACARVIASQTDAR